MVKELTIIIVGVLFMSTASAASFNCAKASSAIEKEICNNTKLSGLDVKLSELYSNMRESSDPGTKAYLKKKQLEWLKERNACPVESKPYYTLEGCISQCYEKRIRQLAKQSEVLKLEDVSKDGLSKTPKITTELGRIITDAMWDESGEVPYSYYRFKDNLVLIEMFGARAAQGVYVVDIAKRKAQHILPGLGEVVKRTPDWWLIRTDGMSRAGMWSSYSILSTSSDSHLLGGIKESRIISVTQDGEAGLCGSLALSKQLGWKVTQNIDSFNLEEKNSHHYILSFHITEQNCQTMKEEKREMQYLINNGVLSKI